MASRQRRLLIAGNWKMNGLKASADQLRGIVAGASQVSGAVDLLICPPATLLAPFAESARGSRVMIGGQDCHAEASGAFTGDLSAEMLADSGATAVIVGHSERRMYHHESDADVRAKAEAAWRAGLTAIVCVGETQTERTAGEALAVIGRQLAGSLPERATAENLILAYEPVWAIGTGLTPTPADVAEVHGFIRERLVERYGPAGHAVRLLYGGSVKPSNAQELTSLPDVDGALVGGASLKATDFLAIAKAVGSAEPAGS
jgi:triosephosphate isomerase